MLSQSLPCKNLYEIPKLYAYGPLALPLTLAPPGLRGKPCERHRQILGTNVRGLYTSRRCFVGFDFSS